MASKKSDNKKIEVNRSAETGRFVTENYAKKHPNTTEHERYKRDTNKK